MSTPTKQFYDWEDEPTRELRAERDTLKRKYAEEYAIVDRVWKALGIKGYDEAKPYSIDEHVARLKAENTRLREAATKAISFNTDIHGQCELCGGKIPLHEECSLGDLQDALAAGKGEMK